MRRRIPGLLLTALLAIPLGSAQATVVLAPSPHDTVCSIDIDGDGRRGLDEPVYLHMGSCSNGVAAGDLRYTGSAGYPGGTLVGGQDHDASAPLQGGSSAWYAYFDADGSGGLNGEDELYLHLGSAVGPLAVGDIPLVGQAAHTTIGPDDPRLNRPLAALGLAVGNESYGDIDGNSVYSTGDRLYLDVDGDLRITIGDVRLASGVAPRQGNSTPDSPPAPANDTSPIVSPSAPPAPPAQASNGSSSAPGRPQDAPAPGAAVALLAAGAWVALRRR